MPPPTSCIACPLQLLQRRSHLHKRRTLQLTSRKKSQIIVTGQTQKSYLTGKGDAQRTVALDWRVAGFELRAQPRPCARLPHLRLAVPFHRLMRNIHRYPPLRQTPDYILLHRHYLYSWSSAKELAIFAEKGDIRPFRETAEVQDRRFLWEL